MTELVEAELKRIAFYCAVLFSLGMAVSCADQPTIYDPGTDGLNQGGKGDFATQDGLIRSLMSEHNVTPVDPGEVPSMNDPKVTLGMFLFFDKALSGNQDVSCATCHHPGFGTSDALSLPVGVGGTGLGPERTHAEDGGFIPRNSPDLFNRGSATWTTMFWDARVSAAETYFNSPAGADLLEGLDSVLAVQAMFPPTSADEMRGHPEDNPIADLEELPEIWAALTERILGFAGYRDLFQAAYPDVFLMDINFTHIANALAAFEVAAFTRLDSPFDRYLAGDNSALDAQEKRGAELFFGDAGCAGCHNGPLLTDQKSHVLATPQLGPGKGDAAPEDEGRFLETKDDADKYAFRTPPLRNVEVTGPYFHSGSYTTLYDVVVHHLYPEKQMEHYNAEDVLRADVAATWYNDEEFVEDCMNRLDPLLEVKSTLTGSDVEDIVAFLLALTDPSTHDMNNLVPTTVMSGLPVDRVDP